MSPIIASASPLADHGSKVEAKGRYLIGKVRHFPTMNRTSVDHLKQVDSQFRYWRTDRLEISIVKISSLFGNI